jgi:hypothetical protein
VGIYNICVCSLKSITIKPNSIFAFYILVFASQVLSTRCVPQYTIRLPSSSPSLHIRQTCRTYSDIPLSEVYYAMSPRATWTSLARLASPYQSRRQRMMSLDPSPTRPLAMSSSSIKQALWIGVVQMIPATPRIVRRNRMRARQSPSLTWMQGPSARRS